MVTPSPVVTTEAEPEESAQEGERAQGRKSWAAVRVQDIVDVSTVLGVPGSLRPDVRPGGVPDVRGWALR